MALYPLPLTKPCFWSSQYIRHDPSRLRTIAVPEQRVSFEPITRFLGEIQAVVRDPADHPPPVRVVDGHGVVEPVPPIVEPDDPRIRPAVRRLLLGQDDSFVGPSRGRSQARRRRPVAGEGLGRRVLVVGFPGSAACKAQKSDRRRRRAIRNTPIFRLMTRTPSRPERSDAQTSLPCPNGSMVWKSGGGMQAKKSGEEKMAPRAGLEPAT